GVTARSRVQHNQRRQPLTPPTRPVRIGHGRWFGRARDRPVTTASARDLREAARSIASARSSPAFPPCSQSLRLHLAAGRNFLIRERRGEERRGEERRREEKRRE